MQKSILVSLAAVLVLFSGCGSDHKGPFSQKEGTDIRIDKLGGMGSPLRQKFSIKEGEPLELHVDVENSGTVGAELVYIECIMSSGTNTLTFERELAGYMSPHGYHKQNMYVDGVAALKPDVYKIDCIVSTTSNDINQTNNYAGKIGKLVEVTIKGDGE